MITVPFSRLRCRTVPVILLLLWGVTFLQGQQQISMQALNGGPFAVGDTAEIGVCLDAGPRQVVGFEFYLDINADIFRPVIDNISAAGNYINPVKAIIGTPFDQVKNNTHGDSLHLDPALNNIDGWQLDFAMTTGVGCPRVWSEISGASPVASFKVEVIGIPYDPAEATIRFVSSDYDTRETGYHYMISNVPGNCITSPRQEITRIDYMVDITSIEINPLLPVDTLITPGTGLSFQLSDDHFQSNVPGVDSTNVTWFVTENAKPAGAGWNLTNSFGINAQLDVTSTGATHGILELLVRVEGTVGPDTFFDQQLWKVWIDYPPVFDQPLLASYVFDEDATYQVGANTNGGGVFFTDQDDTGSNITAWLEPDTLVHVLYDNLNNDLIFSADTNRFTTPDLQARLFIQDNLGVSADTLLTFMVNSVNDTPVVNLDSVSVLGDTVVIHRASPDTLDLDLFVTDVDDASLTWSYTDPYPDTLAVALIAGHLLRLEAGANCPFIDIDLVLTATDDSSASDSDTLVVSIRSWPPEITILDDIKILAGVDSTVALDDWVFDNDTPDSDMTWSFQVVDTAGAPDLAVTTTYNQPSQTVTLSTPTGYAAMDSLIMTVEDDDNNITTDTARLFIFESDAPMIYPLPGLVVYRGEGDSTYAGILDLDDYVADILDDPAAIYWTHSGGDSLVSFDIDGTNHEVTITINPTFLGPQTVTLVATNSRGLKDTSTLAILVSRRVDGPPIWYAVPSEVEVVYGWTTDLFNYSQVCYDETPTDSIIFTPIYNIDSLTVTVAALDSVKLTTPDSTAKYITSLYFTAEDKLGNVSTSNTIIVNVKDSFSPVWQRIPTISLNIGETSSGLFLNNINNISDRDTPNSLLTFSYTPPSSQYITVSYNATTTELTVTAGSRPSDSWLSITATDNKGNTATTLVHVVVFTVADYTPPAGGLTYFFNPVADRWIHYVVTADSSTDINRFIWHYAYGSPPRDWSDHLSFVMKDTLPGTVTWIAPYHFQNEGSYALSVEITDATNNMLDPSPSLLFSVGFSKAIGGVLASPDRQLTVSYPPAPIPNGKLLIIAEDSLPVSTGLSIAKTLSAKGNEENGSQVPAMVYSLDTNLPEPILVTLTYHQKRDTDPYYSFYELDGDQLVKIETYTSADGHFEAAAKLDWDIVFAPSDAPARDAPLPGAELFCYPNPFNATIQVRFLLRWQDQGRIVIYDLLGREVYASPRQPLEPGVHAFSWHSIDKRGLPVPSGTYFIRLETDGSKVHTRKVTLLK